MHFGSGLRVTVRDQAAPKVLTEWRLRRGAPRTTDRASSCGPSIRPAPRPRRPAHSCRGADGLASFPWRDHTNLHLRLDKQHLGAFDPAFAKIQPEPAVAVLALEAATGPGAELL